MSSKHNKHAKSLGKFNGKAGGRQQNNYDFDDVNASPPQVGTSFIKDCWREELYEKYGTEE